MALRPQDIKERLLRELDAAHPLHLLLRLRLVLQVLHLALVVSAVETRSDVRPHRGKRLACDDLLPDRGLDGHLEELSGDDFVCGWAKEGRKG
jgi:hypothetical protein